MHVVDYIAIGFLIASMLLATGDPIKNFYVRSAMPQ